MTGERIILGGAPEGFDARLLAREFGRGQSVIHVARDDKRAEAMRAALAVSAVQCIGAKGCPSATRSVTDARLSPPGGAKSA